MPGNGPRSSLSARGRPAHRSRTSQTRIGLGADGRELQPAKVAGRAADSPDCRGDPEAVREARARGLVRNGYGRVEAFTESDSARQKVSTAQALGRGHEVDYAAAFALALSGEATRSRALADDLARDYPEDTSVQFMYLPTLRALFALDVRDPSAAIQALQTASRYDLAPGGIGFNGYFGRLYPIYVRGLAYLAARQPVEAPPSSSGLSTIEASCSSIPSTRWRGCSWRELSCSRAIP